MKKSKKTLLILSVVIILLLAIHPKTKELISAKSSRDYQAVQLHKEIDMPQGSQAIYEKFLDGVLQYWDGVLYFYDKKGQQRWSKSMRATDPLIRTAGSNVYVLDNTNKQLTRLREDGKEAYKLALEKKIFNYSVSLGQYALLQPEVDDAPLNKILILSPKGDIIGEIAVGEGKIMSFYMDSYKNQIHIHNVIVSGNKAESNIIKYDSRGNLISLQNLGEELLMFYNYEDEAGLVLAFENALLAIDDSGKAKWELPTGRIRLLHHQPEYFIVINTSGAGKSGIIYGKSPDMLKVISKSGKLISESVLEVEPKGVDSFENDIIFFTDRSLYMGIKNNSWSIEYKYTKDIEKAFVFSQGHVILISKAGISFLKF